MGPFLAFKKIECKLVTITLANDGSFELNQTR